VAFVFLACIGSAVSGGATNLVIDSQFVSDKLGKPGWIILDARTAQEYKDVHIPTAINLGEGAAKVLRDPTHRAYTVVPAIEKKLGDAGIGDDKHIIVYGNAADAYYNTVNFWILKFLGCKGPQLSCTAHYFDGGIEQSIKKSNNRMHSIAMVAC
jgi:3-mercaptopyruvate sulfurtransferase SseA